MKIPAEERFFSKISQGENYCWLWAVSKTRRGYGQFNDGSRIPARAHVWVYVFVNGKVPPGKEIHHRCNNRSCVNPFHLQAITHRENLMARPYSDPQKPCNNGHERTGRKANGKIYCLICNRNRERRRAGWTERQIKQLPTIDNKANKAHESQVHP